LTAPEALRPTDEFIAATKAMGLELEEADLTKLGSYLAMLLEMNERMNLTAITEPAAAWMRHAFDALTLVGHLAGIEEDVAAERGVPMRVVDVGSGGGVPGVPLAIVMPSVRFTLLEPTGKKAEFLRHVVSTLGLKNAEVVCDRAERAAGDRATYRELFDAAVVRAVGHVSEIAELCVGFVRVGGAVLAIKGQRAEQEVQEAQKALATLLLDHAGTSATPTGQIVAMVKTQRTPRIYPRHDGEPKRRPLGLASKDAEREGKSGKAG
jgi:16S rRNA (guanine527-N7)-methyltransferase